MQCQNNGPWHLGISAEACKNAGGNWFRTPCVTLKETIDRRPSRFDLTHPVNGTCQDANKTLVTAYVSVDTSHSHFNHSRFPLGHDYLSCLKFCQSLPNYPSQTGMMIKSNVASYLEFNDAVAVDVCTCLYPSGNLPSNENLRDHAIPSPSAFIITNSNGMALGIRPKIHCDSEDDLGIETQLSNPTNPRQQFQLTLDGQIASVGCPQRVLTAALEGTIPCAGVVGLQMPVFETSLVRDSEPSMR